MQRVKRRWTARSASNQVEVEPAVAIDRHRLTVTFWTVRVCSRILEAVLAGRDAVFLAGIQSRKAVKASPVGCRRLINENRA